MTCFSPAKSTSIPIRDAGWLRSSRFARTYRIPASSFFSSHGLTKKLSAPHCIPRMISLGIGEHREKDDGNLLQSRIRFDEAADLVTIQNGQENIRQNHRGWAGADGIEGRRSIGGNPHRVTLAFPITCVIAALGWRCLRQREFRRVSSSIPAHVEMTRRQIAVRTRPPPCSQPTANPHVDAIQKFRGMELLTRCGTGRQYMCNAQARSCPVERAFKFHKSGNSFHWS